VVIKVVYVLVHAEPVQCVQLMKHLIAWLLTGYSSSRTKSCENKSSRPVVEVPMPIHSVSADQEDIALFIAFANLH